MFVFHKRSLSRKKEKEINVIDESNYFFLASYLFAFVFFLNNILNIIVNMVRFVFRMCV
jgi:hypothetical protein